MVTIGGYAWCWQDCFYIGETNMKKINILGTEYELAINDSECMKKNADGLCNFYDKKILFRSADNLLEPDSSSETKEIRQQEVKRHEIIHAFFEESGLVDYANNEQLVEWIAVQFPKMLEVFKETNSI